MKIYQDNQLIVYNFCQKLNISFNNTMFKQQIGVASMLLKEYSYEDIILVICYLRVFPHKKPIRSLGFIPYIIDETLIKAKHYFKQLEDNLIPKIPIKEEKKIEIKNEVIGKKSLFSKNRRF